MINTNATNVKVNVAKLREKVLPMLDEIEKTTFDETIHESTDGIEERLRYILVVDALNFCNGRLTASRTTRSQRA